MPLITANDFSQDNWFAMVRLVYKYLRHEETERAIDLLEDNGFCLAVLQEHDEDD